MNFDIGLAKNILEELRRNNVNIFENRDILEKEESLKKYINKDNMKINSEEDLYYFIRILTAIVRSVTMEVFSERISKEEGRKMLEKELEIIKKGIEK